MNKFSFFSIIKLAVLFTPIYANASELSCSVISEPTIEMSTPVKTGSIISDTFIITHACTNWNKIKSENLKVRIDTNRVSKIKHIYAVGDNVFNKATEMKISRCSISENWCEFKIKNKNISHFETKINVIIDAKSTQFAKTENITDLMTISYIL